MRDVEIYQVGLFMRLLFVIECLCMSRAHYQTSVIWADIRDHRDVLSHSLAHTLARITVTEIRPGHNNCVYLAPWLSAKIFAYFLTCLRINYN